MILCHEGNTMFLMSCTGYDNSVTIRVLFIMCYLLQSVLNLSLFIPRLPPINISWADEFCCRNFVLFINFLCVCSREECPTVVAPVQVKYTVNTEAYLFPLL